MREFFYSLLEFTWGLIKRWWIWVWTIVLDPFEFYNNYIRDWSWTPEGEIDMPSEWFVPLLVGFLFLAGGWTYHELRQKAKSPQPSSEESNSEAIHMAATAEITMIDGPDKQYPLAGIMEALEKPLVTGMTVFHVHPGQLLNDNLGGEWSSNNLQEALTQLRLLGVVDVERVPIPHNVGVIGEPDARINRYTWNDYGIRVLLAIRRSRQ